MCSSSFQQTNYFINDHTLNKMVFACENNDVEVGQLLLFEAVVQGGCLQESKIAHLMSLMF